MLVHIIYFPSCKNEKEHKFLLVFQLFILDMWYLFLETTRKTFFYRNDYKTHLIYKISHLIDLQISSFLQMGE